MAAYLSKSDASEGFNQILNFLNGSSIKYALTVNPNIYVSCIKQFWNTVVVKQVNDVTRLQALVDKKKVVGTEAAIRELLRLDDAEGVDCLPNEEFFIKLARMGYEKPSTKPTFYKAFFSSHWKFLIHTNLQCMSAKRISWNEISSSMASAVICLSTGKRFSGVETPLFEGMLVEQEADEEGDADEHVEEVTPGDDAHGDDSAAHEEVRQTPPQSPQVQPPSPQPQPQAQLQQAIDFPMSLLQEALDACAAFTRRVEHFEYDKVAQALEITKLKRRVKKLKNINKVRVLKLRRLRRVGTSQRVDTSDDTVMDDESNQGRMIAKMDKDDAVVLMDDKEEDKNVEEAKEDETEPAKVQKVVDIVTTAKLITEVVTAASETVTATSVIIPTAEPQVPAATLTVAPARVADASNKGKGIMVEEPKPLKKKQQIEMDEQYARELHAELNKDIDWDEAIDHLKRKAKEDHVVKRYQVLKRKPQTEAQARKNMIMYLKNVASFKMDYFKGMSYDDIRPIFEAKERAAKRRKLDKEVEDLKRHLGIMPNEDDDVYTEATLLARKDLEALWSLVKERFSTAKPKNFSDDFLLTTLGAMFETPDAHAQI
uniref:Xylulose kinase-1 n=1 Tax=Tanacetum cinerariifolium TaxID=118510 RepID=A0A6L2M7V4_TANCI|nr:hypothetical protein [Tanacetum cinerariifolium]